MRQNDLSYRSDIHFAKSQVRAQGKVEGAILAAASKMFADRGYEAVTLREIAKEIGYTHAVIYQHFPDKWHILVELTARRSG